MAAGASPLTPLGKLTSIPGLYRPSSRQYPYQFTTAQPFGLRARLDPSL